jgi:hypothetical protein
MLFDGGAIGNDAFNDGHEVSEESLVGNTDRLVTDLSIPEESTLTPLKGVRWPVISIPAAYVDIGLELSPESVNGIRKENWLPLPTLESTRS